MRIAIVGAGVGGLSAAARLARQGQRVRVYEKLPRCGGRANIIEDKGFRFDTGPSFVLMPDFFEEAFSSCGERLGDYLDLASLETSYRIFYADGSALGVYRDPARTKEDLEKIEPGSSRRYDRFIAETARIYEAVRPLLYRCFTPSAALRPSYWGLVKKIRALESYWGLARRYFRTDKLRYAFTFEAMFIGVSPFQSPAFYSIISYADHVQKVHHPMGGMYRIPLALERLGKKFGVEYFYEAEATRIARHGRALRLTVNEETQEYDRIVVNADYAYAQSVLLGRQIPRYKYSCSVFLLYLGLKKRVQEAGHHNLFFARDLKRNLAEIFGAQAAPASLDFSFYVHAPTKTDASLAPEGKEIFYILVPVPNLERGGGLAAREELLRKAVFERINQAFGIRLEELIEVEHRFYPQDFISRYNIKYGATFGLAHTLWQSAFFRPPNYDPRLKGLYFVGASTQPGGGLPPVIASARIVSDLVSAGA